MAIVVIQYEHLVFCSIRRDIGFVTSVIISKVKEKPFRDKMGSKSSPNLEVCPSEWCWNLQSHGQLKATIFWGASRRICSLEAKNLTCAINQRRSVLSPSKMIKHSVWKSSKNVRKFIIFICPKLFEFPLFFVQNFTIELNFYAKLGKIMFRKMRLFWSIFIHCVGHY